MPNAASPAAAERPRVQIQAVHDRREVLQRLGEAHHRDAAARQIHGVRGVDVGHAGGVAAPHMRALPGGHGRADLRAVGVVLELGQLRRGLGAVGENAPGGVDQRQAHAGAADRGHRPALQVHPRRGGDLVRGRGCDQARGLEEIGCGAFAQHPGQEKAQQDRRRREGRERRPKGREPEWRGQTQGRAKVSPPAGQRRRSFSARTVEKSAEMGGLTRPRSPSQRGLVQIEQQFVQLAQLLQTMQLGSVAYGPRQELPTAGRGVFHSKGGAGAVTMRLNVCNSRG